MPDIGYPSPGSEIVESKLGPAGQVGGSGAAGGAGGGTGGGGISSVTNLDLTTVNNIISNVAPTPPLYFASNPKYGIKGDGMTDDGPAIQALMNYIASQGPMSPGGIIIFDAKTYLIKSKLNIPANGIQFWGCATLNAAGPSQENQTIIQSNQSPGSSSFGIQLSGGGFHAQDITFSMVGNSGAAFIEGGGGGGVYTFLRCLFVVENGSANQFLIEGTSDCKFHFLDCTFLDRPSANQLWNIIPGGSAGGCLNFTNCHIGYTEAGNAWPFLFEGAYDSNTDFSLRYTNCDIWVPTNYRSDGYARFNPNGRTNRSTARFLGCRIILNGYNGIAQYQVNDINNSNGDNSLSFIGCDVDGGGQNRYFAWNPSPAAALHIVGNNFFNFAPNTAVVVANLGLQGSNFGIFGNDVSQSASSSPATFEFPDVPGLVFVSAGTVTSGTMNLFNGGSYPINPQGPWYVPPSATLTLQFSGSITLHWVAL